MFWSQPMYKELIDELRESAGCFDYDGCVETAILEEKAADAIEELLKRETPMRLRTTTSTKRCPSCNRQVSGIWNIHANYQFCRWCGQALDWSED